MQAINRDNFGFGEFVWFVGVVEDVNDPIKGGRVRVRIFGYHSEDIPLDDLPWALVASPTTSSSTSGIGTTPHALIVGTHVIGFFTDGHSAQLPMIMLSYPGVTGGSSDIHKITDMTRIERTPPMTVSGEGGWSEKTAPGQSRYPNNKVTHTTSGHTIEVDDTPGNSRLNIQHSSGTFAEIHDDGSMVIHTTNDSYNITEGNVHIKSTGNVSISVDGNVYEQISGNKKTVIAGNYEIICTNMMINTRNFYYLNVGTTSFMRSGGVTSIQGSLILLN